MNCPKCKNEQHCGCINCAPEHTKNGRIHSKPEGNYDTCGHCGLKMHVDAWLDECAKQIKETEANSI